MTTASNLSDYERQALMELRAWRQEMQQQPGMVNWAAQRLQAKINTFIPEKVHATVTELIKQMTRAVLAGSNYSLNVQVPPPDATLNVREAQAKERVEFYMKAAATEGGITGAGGIFLGLADFPLLLGIKFKLLFELAAIYGHAGSDFKERLYILHIFQLAFSSQEHRRNVFAVIDNWDGKTHPTSIDDYDWRTFQQEYRNYIDLAKLAQLMPVIGAPVGAIVNHRLLGKLGATAMNAYRMRWFAHSGALVRSP
jgi:hypothetical protein